MGLLEVKGMETTVSANQKNLGLKKTLCSLAAEVGSVRLLNSLMSADSEGALPAKTVSDYVALGPGADSLFMKLPRMGRKTAQELSDIVTEYLLTIPEKNEAKEKQDYEGDVGPIIGEKLVSEIVNSYSGDCRLINIFLQNADEYSVLKMTYSDWAAMPERVRKAKFRKLINFGEKTFLELSEAVSRFEDDLQNYGKDNCFRSEGLEGGGEDVPLSKIIEVCSDDVRLRRFFSSSSFDAPIRTMSLSEWMSITELARLKAFKVVAGLGEKSYSELKDAIDRYLSRYGSGESVYCLEQKSGDRRFGGGKDFSAINKEVVGIALERLSEKQQEILRLRFSEGLTLEEVGKIFSVTRERIRQIEKKGVQRFSREYSSYFGHDVSSILFDQVWGFIVGEGAFLRKTSFSERNSGLPFEVKLACVAISGSVASLISEFAVDIKSYWVVGYELDQIESAIDGVERIAIEGGLPAVFDVVKQKLNVSDELLYLSCNVSNSCHEYKGVINSGILSIRRKRCAELWILFSREYSCGPVRLMQLHLKYVELCPNDQCSPRDILIVMQEYPKLFQRVGSLGWVMLARVCPTSEGGESDIGCEEKRGGEIDGVASDSKSLREILIDILSSTPLPYKDIFEAVRIASSGFYSKGSIAALLSSYPEFDFFGPGVVGLYEFRDNESHIAKARSFLLEDIPVRQYIYANVAGWPQVEYPAWNVEYFNLVVDALLVNGDSKALGTLLSSVNLESLSLDDFKRERLYEILHKRNDRIESPQWSGSTLAGLSAERIIKSAWIAVKLGGFNWILGNRVTGERLDSLRKGPNLLMMLVGAGILDRDGSWLHSKLVEREATSILLDMLASFQDCNDYHSRFWRHLYDLVSSRGIEGCFTATRKSELLELLEKQQLCPKGELVFSASPSESGDMGDDLDAEGLDDLLEDELLRILE